MADISEGDRLETAMLSPLVGDHLVTWGDDDRRHWRVEDADDLRALLGRGLLARTEVEPGRYREVGLLDERARALVLLPRMAATASDAELSTPVRVVTLHPADEDDRPPPATSFPQLADLLDAIVAASAARGEFVVVERVGWDHQPEPYTVFLVTQDAEWGWLSVVETAPPAAGTPHWPDVPAGQGGQTITAPADEETLAVAGLLMAEAVSCWSRHPLDVALTFGPTPDGPSPPPDVADAWP